MSKLDEADLWAFRQKKRWTPDLQVPMAQAYRAGQAASAERIKALEEALRALVVLHDSPTRPGADYAVARALLKEADQ